VIAICPACIAGMALVAAGATSSGGLTAFAASKIFKRKTSTRSEKRKTKQHEMEGEK
jgi:hypothetical protein